ncbi:Spore coat protein CotF [Dendrosporobacter quercicolus]|uniref:Spore coat protein CotF n=1 Tax=Dendrosporobacter quercicolus TaxID=146817 RepID=A0A1G9URS3_9FIRM|nr:spore coat protein [Dendrosporobacter quercicolus]SDM62661.1 Spore coat protein CotF [Dendrosporobacter quercicolus]
MALNLSRKEQMLLQDQKKHEQICVQKYQSYANQTQTPQLKQLFTNYAQAEQQHLNTINQILSGQVPDVQQQGQQQNQQGQQQNQQGSGQPAGAGSPSAFAGGPNDAALLNDMLMTEKYVSGTYDTAIFEFADPSVRQVLNHIQKEEQEHGEGLFKYMQSQGLYNVQ